MLTDAVRVYTATLLYIAFLQDTASTRVTDTQYISHDRRQTLNSTSSFLYWRYTPSSNGQSLRSAIYLLRPPPALCLGCDSKTLRKTAPSWRLRWLSPVLVTHCLKKVPTFKLSVALSNLNWFSKFLQRWKAYEICYKAHKTLPNSP